MGVFVTLRYATAKRWTDERAREEQNRQGQREGERARGARWGEEKEGERAKETNRAEPTAALTDPLSTSPVSITRNTFAPSAMAGGGGRLLEGRAKGGGRPERGRRWK